MCALQKMCKAVLSFVPDFNITTDVCPTEGVKMSLESETASFGVVGR